MSNSKKNKKTIIDIYLNYTKKYRDIYGKKCVVLLESGHFMEMYDYVDTSDHMIVARDILGIIITRRDKSDNSSPFMAGIPTIAIRRYYKTLLKNNYTVICVTQVTPPPNVTRDVTKILSPGCNLSEDIYYNPDHGSSIICGLSIEIDEEDDYFIYLCIFDTNIGSSRLETIFTDNNIINNENLLNKTKEILDISNYNEILVNIIYSNKHLEKEVTLDYIKNSLQIHGKLSHFKFYHKGDVSNYYKESFQTSFLETIFCQYKNIYTNIQEVLGIKNVDISLIVNYLLLLDFISLHDKTLIKNLPKPFLTNEKYQNYMISYNDTYKKLNIFEDNGNIRNSLFHYIDQSSTKPAKRLLIDHLKYPLLNHEELNNRYSRISELIDKPESIEFIDNNLNIIDLQRVYRRFSIGKLNPYELPKIDYSNNQIKNIINYFNKNKNFKCIEKQLLPDSKKITKYQDYIENIKKIFDLEKCSKVTIQNISDTLFKKGYDKDIDKLVNTIDEKLDLLQNIGSYLSNLLEKESKFISVRHNDKDGYWLDISKKRGLKLKDYISSNKINSVKLSENFTLDVNKVEYNTQNKTNIKINSSQIKTISISIIKLKEKLIEQTRKKYISTIDEIYEKYYSCCIESVIHFITNIDLIKSNAKCVLKFKYNKPKLVEEEYSYIKLDNIRHPIIEQLIKEKGSKYIGNSIDVGPDKSHIIYGVNSVGKSSLLKSISIAVIMAQAGMFVAADSMEISLYKKLFTRTGNNDNLFTNHSSFVKEMSESREIIKKSDNNSLVIADELCASTELDSAVKIVSGIIKILSDKKSSFIFATHIFKLAEIEIIQKIQTVNFKHLKVRFEKELIFERKLTDGLPENKSYGILVASKVIQDEDFNNIINNLSNFSEKDHSIISKQKSKYNSAIYMTKCEICKYQPKGMNDIPLETHHINFQCCADKKGYHGNFHKNEAHNLVVLCKHCHVSVHNKKIIINGYIEKDDGNHLSYTLGDPEIFLNNESSSEEELHKNAYQEKKRKKFNKKTVHKIKLFFQENSFKTKNQIYNEYREKNNIKISYPVFNSIISDNY